jgi:hypothetical protein
VPELGKDILDSDLTSPWDIVHWKDEKFLVAVSGTHQIWMLDLNINSVSLFSGTGIEGNKNDDNLLECTWAQPSGLAILHNILYIADSESSTIRAIDLTKMIAYNVIGGDGNPKNLFAFGDYDGIFTSSRLQHPLACVPINEKLLIADSYNNKLKFVYPRT